MKEQFSVSAQPVQFAKIVSMPFDENTFIIWRQGRKDCVVIDPGMQPSAIISALAERQLSPAAILCTHGHVDHIAGNGPLKEQWPECPLVIGAGDAYKLLDPMANLSGLYGFDFTSPPADQVLAEGDEYEAAGLEFRVIDTPGHSAGHVTFLLTDGEQTHCISGDVIFQGSVGRTDFPDGDFEALREAIHSKIFRLPESTMIYPGHGPTTTVGAEKKGNPFVGAPAGYVVA